MRSPEYFRDKADEARTMATEMTSEEAQNTLLNIAEQYDELVGLAEQEEARRARHPLASASASRSS